jgi:hypothetical protein
LATRLKERRIAVKKSEQKGHARKTSGGGRDRRRRVVGRALSGSLMRRGSRTWGHWPKRDARVLLPKASHLLLLAFPINGSPRTRSERAEGRKGGSAACCVIAITAVADCMRYAANEEEGAMANRAYEGWWDTSLIEGRNERALLSAFVAAIAVWATVFLFALL